MTGGTEISLYSLAVVSVYHFQSITKTMGRGKPVCSGPSYYTLGVFVSRFPSLSHAAHVFQREGIPPQLYGQILTGEGQSAGISL